MRKLIAVTLAVAILSGCATTQSNPIPIAQTGDENKTCALLFQEIGDARARVVAADQAGTVQTRKNVIYGVTGFFILVPWFFMDLGNAPDLEKKAAHDRLARLEVLRSGKKCGAAV